MESQNQLPNWFLLQSTQKDPIFIYQFMLNQTQRSVKYKVIFHTISGWLRMFSYETYATKEITDEAVEMNIAAPPRDGEANAELIDFFC